MNRIGNLCETFGTNLVAVGYRGVRFEKVKHEYRLTRLEKKSARNPFPILSAIRSGLVLLTHVLFTS